MPKKRQKRRVGRTIQLPRKQHADKPQALRPVEDTITSEPIKHEESDSLPEDVRKHAEDLENKIQSDPQGAIPDLKTLIEASPHIPMFYNHLTSADSLLGDHRNTERFTLEMCRKFPDYLFAKLNYAQICLEHNELDKILPSPVSLFLDTWHSGHIRQDIHAVQKQVDKTEAIRTLSSDEYGVVILAASTGGKFLMEHSEWGHGAFRKALSEALEEGQVDYSGDGIIHLRELDLYVAKRVEMLTQGEQHPTTQKPSTISRFAIVQVSD